MQADTYYKEITMKRLVLHLAIAALLTLPASPGISEAGDNTMEVPGMEGKAFKGMYDDALAAAQKALELAEKVSGKDHENTAKCLNDVGVLYDRQGRYTEAEQLYARSLAILERILASCSRKSKQSCGRLLFTEQISAGRAAVQARTCHPG